jgi:sortase (surface protein transpeptidase)
MRRKANQIWKFQLLSVSVIAVTVAGTLLGAFFLPPLSIPDSIGVLPIPAIAASPIQGVGLPVRIKIPSISVDAKVEKVAIAKNGAMAVPKNPLNTGWYQYGVKPGEIGSAVIDGHVDWWSGTKAIFEHLHKVKVDETITVQDDKGANITFIVKKVRKYNAKADATDIFLSNDGKAHLNLITCTGKWNKITKQYSERLVVFAEKM